MEEKTIIITGAAKRIGLFLTGYFLSLGYKVIAVVRKPSTELLALESLNKNKIQILQKDFDRQTIDEDFWFTVGRINLSGFIHCASIFKHDTIENSSKESRELHQKINCDIFVDACTTYVQSKRPQYGNPTSFIAFLDCNLNQLNVDFYSYTLSKLSLKSSIPFLAMNGAPKIRVNAISPGLILPSGEQTQEEFESTQKKLPYGYGANLEDIGQSSAFLIMSPSLNGQIIDVDAGQHLQKQRDILFKN